MFYWKPTKLKTFISSIPLLILVITDLILYIRLVFIGPPSEIPKITIYAVKILPFFTQISKFVHSFSFSLDDIYPPSISFKTLFIAEFNDVLVGLVYFILIYLIYSFIQSYRLKRK